MVWAASSSNEGRNMSDTRGASLPSTSVIQDATVAEPPPPSLARKLAAAGYYMGASIAVQYATKALFTNLGFKHPLTVAFLQMLVIAPVMWAVDKPKPSWKTAWSVLPLALVNVANMVTGLIGTSGLNVPMFIVLRRFTLVFTIGMERLLLGKTHDATTLAAVALMILGAAIAAAGDLTFNACGYAAVFANNIATAAYLVLVKRGGKAGLSTGGLLAYNATLTLPLLALGVWVSGDAAAALSFPGRSSPAFLATLAASAALGLSINHSTFVCTRVNEPLVTSTAGSFKNVLMTVIGAVAFGDFVFSPANATGIVVSMAGAVWYAAHSASKSKRELRAYETMVKQKDASPDVEAAEQEVVLKHADCSAIGDNCHPRRGERGP